MSTEGPLGSKWLAIDPRNRALVIVCEHAHDAKIYSARRFGVAVDQIFVTQTGELAIEDVELRRIGDADGCRLQARERAGGQWTEWPPIPSGRSQLDQPLRERAAVLVPSRRMS